MDKQDYEYLTGLCLKDKEGKLVRDHKDRVILQANWIDDHDTQISVAHKLLDNGMFNDDEPADIIYFFEKPWKYGIDVITLIKEYELENGIIKEGEED